MGKNANFVSHKKSKLKNQDGSPQLPSSSALVEGEIAINFAENVETLSIKNESGDVVTFSSDNYYSEKKLGSAFTGANSAVTVTDVLENLDLGNEVEVNSGDTPTGETIEIWVDESEDPEEADVYTKAETDTLLLGKLDVSDFNTYSGATDTLIGTKASENDLEALSGTVTAHTANTEVHVTAANKTAWDAKVDFADIADFFDGAEYDSSAKTINFYHGDSVVDSIDATAFIKDGMVNDVKIDDVEISGETVTCLVVTFNTDAGKEDINIPLTNIFDPNNYYTKDEVDDIVSGLTDTFNETISGITDIIDENEEITAAALTDLDERKLDTTAYTPTDLSDYYTKEETDARDLWVSGSVANSVVMKNGNNSATGSYSIAEGQNTVANGQASHAEGFNTETNNLGEHASGKFNVSNTAASESGQTLFSVGNGTGTDARHNAFEIMQNGDIYIVNKEGQDVRLQDEIGNIDIDQIIDSGTSASTDAVSTSAVYGFVTSYTPSITVDQDFSNTASTNPISTQAVYSAVTDNELVWTNAFVTLSGEVSAHTANTEIHVTAADKEKLHTHSNKSALDSITGNVGTMAYESASSYSSATEVNTALANKANTSDLNDFFDDAKYEDSGTTKVINFYHGNTIKATIDASDFIVDGMVDDVRIENGNLVIDFNTASGKQDISIPLTDIFDPSNYYNKTAIDNLVGSGFTSSSITDVIIENEQIVSAALTDLDNKKLDASAYTPTEELWVSGTGLNSVVLKGSSGTASGDYSVAEGLETVASGNYSHAEGEGASAITDDAHAEGWQTIASGDSSHAEGWRTQAIGDTSHAEGDSTSATSDFSHAEGISTLASGESSHAEGSSTKASGDYSHAEGNSTNASGESSHAEGQNTFANGYASHAEGQDTEANGWRSHTEGFATIANNKSEHASGQYNVSNSATTEFGNSGNTLFSVGNGTSTNARHNAFEVRQNGDIYIVSGGTDIKLQDNIGKVDVISAITPSNSGSTAPIATKVVAENELTVSNALNDLSTNKADKSTTYTKTEIDDMIGDIETLLAAI